MHSIHAAKVGLWISIHNPQASRPPCSTEVNPETPVVCKRVPDPLGMEAMLDDDDDSTAVVEIPDRDAAPLTRPIADCFNDERISAGVRRPRDTRKKGNVGDGVRDTNNLLRKSHLIPHIAKQIGLKVPVIWRDIREALMPQNKLPAPVTWRSRLIGKSLSGSILMRCFRGSTEFDGPLGLRNRYINLCRQGFAELVGVLVC